MALPTGTISMANVRSELRRSGQIRLGDSDVRGLAGRPSGPISMADLRGKSSSTRFSVLPKMRYIIDEMMDLEIEMRGYHRDNRLGSISGGSWRGGTVIALYHQKARDDYRSWEISTYMIVSGYVDRSPPVIRVGGIRLTLETGFHYNGTTRFKFSSGSEGHMLNLMSSGGWVSVEIDN